MFDFKHGRLAHAFFDRGEPFHVCSLSRTAQAAINGAICGPTDRAGSQCQSGRQLAPALGDLVPDGLNCCPHCHGSKRLGAGGSPNWQLSVEGIW